MVLLKKLGIHVEENAGDVDIKTKFTAAFHGDLSEKKKYATQILLRGELDFSFMGLDLSGLDEEAV